jgi:PadR family transcriptional regulator PadR
MNVGKDLVAASAGPLVLGILSEGESYGYAILQRVREVSGGSFSWTDGMLYPLLHRLERLEQISAHWGASDTGRKRKYYRITRKGREALAEQRRQWETVDAALRSVWRDMKVAARSTPSLARSGGAA